MRLRHRCRINVAPNNDDWLRRFEIAVELHHNAVVMCGANMLLRLLLISSIYSGLSIDNK